MSETRAAGICPRCGGVVGTWHTRPQCDAAYERAYRAANPRMTADHPTREERYTAALADWMPFLGYWVLDDPDANPPTMRLVDRERPGDFAALAAALVAADPEVPAQPDAALSDEEIRLHWFGGANDDECQECGYWAHFDSVRRHHVEDALKAALAARAAQPAPAPEVWGDVLRVARTAVDSAYGTDPRHDLLARAVADAVAYGKPLPWSLSKHFGRATPAPEVSRGVAEACGCFACIGNKPAGPTGWLTIGMTRMIVCAECGNKRCPHGTDHRNACTGSNEPGQVGSRYGGALPAEGQS